MHSARPIAIGDIAAHQRAITLKFFPANINNPTYAHGYRDRVHFSCTLVFLVLGDDYSLVRNTLDTAVLFFCAAHNLHDVSTGSPEIALEDFDTLV